MTPKAPNSKQSDPRIISPQIKVVYPSQSTEKDLPVSSEQTTAPAPQVLPTQTTPAPVTVKETVSQETTATTTATPPPTATVNAEPAKPSTWKDALREHTTLFIAIALLSIGIGILIGKKI